MRHTSNVQIHTTVGLCSIYTDKYTSRLSLQVGSLLAGAALDLDHVLVWAINLQCEDGL